MLALQDLQIRFGHRPIVDGLTLHLQPGFAVGLAGESGCGKSTVLRAIAGLLPAVASVYGRCQAPRKIGYIPQDLLSSLSPFLTIGQHLQDAGAAPQSLPRLGLQPELAARYPHQLSGGQRQRVLVALALAGQPELILADEPTSQLDPATAQLVLAALAETVARTGAALLIASHQEAVFRQLACSVHRLTPAPEAATLPTPAAPATDTVLDVRGLSKAYFRRDWLLRKSLTKQALADVSLSVHAGETVVLAGPSGAGKSTLALCIAGREPWQSGEIRLRRGPAAVQLVPQEPSESLNRSMTLADCLREASGRADPAMLEQLALPGDWLQRSAGELSEGQRARVAIARTVAALQGGLLILDESLSGLDPVSRGHVLTHLRRTQAETGLACLLISHDPHLATEIGARTVVLEHGRLAG